MASLEDIKPDDRGDHVKDHWKRPDFDLDEVDAIMNTPAEIFEKPRCRGVVEWVNSLLFDVILLVVEAAINLWLANTLIQEGLVLEYRAIIVMLIMPSVVNPLVWLGLKSHYKISGTLIFVLLVVGFPSPLFLYLWHLYLSLFSSFREAETAKLLSNTFRMVHAIVCSLPLMIINLSTLYHQLQADGFESYAMDLNELKAHLSDVPMHGWAFAFSFINFVRGACLYNERQTMTMMFGLVALPFTILTTLCRVHVLALIIAFVEPEWTTILLVGLFIANLVMIWSCRKGTKLIKGQVTGLRGTGDQQQIIHPVRSTNFANDDLNMTCSNPGSQKCLTSCCCNTQWTRSTSGFPTVKSGKYVLTKDSSESCWSGFGQLICLSVPAMIIPSGYTNDYKSYHPRIKGGLYIVLNYLVNMSIMGVTLGYVILHRIPNDIHGITISNPSIGVVVPNSKILINAGVQIGIDMPKSTINLGEMPSMDLSANLKDIDQIIAIIAPIMFAVACLPFVIMRAAMMELDCFITRRKQLGENFDDLIVLEGFKHRPRVNNRRLYYNQSLAEILASNSESKELKCRLYLSLICSGFGMFVMTGCFMGLGAFIAMQFINH